MGSHPKVVIALGGNALQEAHAPATAEAQLAVVNKTAEIITDIKCIYGYELAIVHGNGPQIGRILLASELAAEQTPPLPLDVCAAMSQGYIGYHIQQGLRQALASRKRPLPVVTLVTQVVVDPADPAFHNPTKPIGPFYQAAAARRLMAERQFAMVEDAGRGWRRVVPSPLPRRIVEIQSIKALWDSTIVIAAGGGGIAVVERPDGTFAGVAAVIDKDLAAAKLAEEVGADILMILTGVERVALHYQQPNQQPLDRLTVAECEQYIWEGHFAPGSMLPKVQAAAAFARLHPEKKAIITSLERAVDALAGQAGTIVTLN